VVQGRTITYGELRELSCRIAATLQSHPGYSTTPLTAVFAYRTPVAFAGVLGALLAGNGYVPLNRTFPLERTKAMLERSQCRSVIIDADSLKQLLEILPGLHNSMLVILPDKDDIGTLRQQWPTHYFVSANELLPSETWQEPDTSKDSVAYILFTSGSTGIPKGVVVAQRSVIAFIDYMTRRYQISADDRLSQMFDMTFDLSAFDMFVSWERAACLCCPSTKTLISPAKFIREMQLTVWFSVPSTISFMKQLGTLKPNSFPSLRVSLFCGESLPISSTLAWLKAAPNSIVENLYGPTELTIACTLYRWDPIRSPAESELGLVPIGYPYPDMKVLVVDSNLREVGPGQEGELLMNGPQMALGYWNDPQRTSQAFVVPPARTDIFYRTGDLVRRAKAGAPLIHLGRIDFQVKILGHRVELGEIEKAVRDATGLEGVVAVGWPVTESGFGGVDVFIEGNVSHPEAIRTFLASRLPDYMIPRKLHFMAQLPRNTNGKFDRKEMMRMLEAGL